MTDFPNEAVEAALTVYERVLGELLDTVVTGFSYRPLRVKAMRAAITAAAPWLGESEGWVLVPREPAHEQVRAMSESIAVDDEGAFPSLGDLIDCSGENKTRTVLAEAYRRAIAAAPKPTLPRF